MEHIMSAMKHSILADHPDHTDRTYLGQPAQAQGMTNLVRKPVPNLMPM